MTRNYYRLWLMGPDGPHTLEYFQEVTMENGMPEAFLWCPLSADWGLQYDGTAMIKYNSKQA